jgi:hypothetical protein
MKFGFIAKHRGIWPVAWLCEVLGLHLPLPGKRLLRIGLEVLDPPPKQVRMHIQVAACLRYRNPAIANQSARLKLELSTERPLPLCHFSPPVSS